MFNRKKNIFIHGGFSSQSCFFFGGGYMCHGQKSPYWGWSSHLLIGILIINGYINPYGLGLMSLSPYYMESWEFFSTRSHISDFFVFTMLPCNWMLMIIAFHQLRLQESQDLVDFFGNGRPKKASLGVSFWGDCSFCVGFGNEDVCIYIYTVYV